jgi:predicted nuclease of predicted toxin-antitoxin system
MLRLYSNENFPFAMVKALRHYKYDILTSYDAGQANQGIPDEDVLAYATAEERVIITLNRDDFISLHRQGIDHSGIIICKDDRDYQGQIDFLHNYLVKQTESLVNRLIRVQKQNQPKSPTSCFIIREYVR